MDKEDNLDIMECYSIVKKKKKGHFSDVEEPTVFVLQSEVRKTLYMNAYIWTLLTEKWY